MEKYLKDKSFLVWAGLLLFLVWAVFPLFFKWIVSLIGSDITELGQYGAIGDIYGSLNTLFTSVTLVIVIISTMMQRQANQDAREAMALQLEQARVASKTQLKLAKDSHDAQIKESQYAIFSNMFYSLMNQKNNMMINTNISVVKNKDNYIFFYDLVEEFDRKKNVWSKNIDKISENDISSGLEDFLQRNFMGKETELRLISYLYNYICLLTLIKRSDFLDVKDKEFFIETMVRSMQLGEQIALFWVGVSYSEFHTILEDTNLIRINYNDDFLIIFRKFGCRTYFKNAKYHQNWDKFETK